LRLLDLSPYLRVDSPIPHDIRFLVEDPVNPSIRVQISAHKFLLALISPVFQAQFYGHNRMSGDSVVVQDCDPWSFQRLVDFIYSASIENFLLVETDTLPMVAIEKLFNLIKAADRFMISSLVNLCNKSIRCIPINEQNVFILASSAENINHIDILSRDIFYKCGVFIRNSILFDATFAERVSEQDKQVFEHLAGMDILEAHLAIRKHAIGGQGGNSNTQDAQQNNESTDTNGSTSNEPGSTAGKEIPPNKNVKEFNNKEPGETDNNFNNLNQFNYATANIEDDSSSKVSNGAASEPTIKPDRADPSIIEAEEDCSSHLIYESKDTLKNMASSQKEASGSKSNYLNMNGDEDESKTNNPLENVTTNEEDASDKSIGATQNASAATSDIKDTSICDDAEKTSFADGEAKKFQEVFEKEATKARTLVWCMSDNQPILVESVAHFGAVTWKGLVRSSSTSPVPPTVEYGKMLRPPYHLMSLLRFMPGAAKGYSFTDKNTMIFVVLEGELLVTIHKTEISARRGDCFYVPTKNGYNIINTGDVMAELALVQYQYDGPLPQGELLG